MTAGPPQLHARWIFPVDRPPVADGVVRIADGRIVAVETADATRPFGDDAADLALIPGLVNTHTHLEFSELRSPFPAGETFADWIRSVVEYRRARTTPVPEILGAGLRESAAAGVTTLGEIATAGWSSQPFDAAAPRTVAFREALALDPSNSRNAEAPVGEHLADVREHSNIIGGISPHAPYSVHPHLFRSLVDLALQSRAPLAFHLAETSEELELLAHGTGPLVDSFSAAGFWQPDAIPRGSRPLDYLRLLAPLPRVLVIHGNYLADDEIDFLAGKPQFTVIYCPRTHAHFGHEPHPWLKLRERGVRVALGTDSRASNPDLSLWNELQFLKERFPQIAPRDLLRLATIDGAEALGIEHLAGTLAPGKSADIAVIQLAGADRDDPWERLLHPDSRPVATLRSGSWIAGAR